MIVDDRTNWFRERLPSIDGGVPGSRAMGGCGIIRLVYVP